MSPPSASEAHANKNAPLPQTLYRALSQTDLSAIHAASLEVLQTTGYHMPVQEARSLIAENGGRVVGERVYVTPEMVERAFKTLRPVRLYDRQGSPSPVVQPGRVCFGTIADTFYVHDPYTRSTRPFLKDDQRWLTTVIDALDNIEYVQVVGQAHDVPNELQSQAALLQTLRNTAKPILVYPYDRAGLLDILDAVSIVAGGWEAFEQKPFLMCAAVPAGPLAGSEYHLELLLTCAERNIPVLNYNCPALGGNSPADIAATIVLSNADWLANLVLHQLKRPGAPFCTAGFTMQLMDMRSTLWAYCAPETLQAYSAIADLAHFYQMPAFGLEMTCDIPTIDAQMGLEFEAQCIRALLSGVEMVHNAGIYGAGKLCGAEAVILADETIAYTRASMKPIWVEAEALSQAIELIRKIGPLGEYISQEHTLKNFRKFWYPKVFERPMFDPRADQPGAALVDRLNQRARWLIENHHPLPLPEDVLDQLDTLERTWYARSQRESRQTHPK
ncbi:MAG: trimethylamine methyltransferase family protein [Anaerolineales bacterium]|nr:trimethylamine methyltransferase family protein [Anaerolineales bacterium]